MTPAAQAAQAAQTGQAGPATEPEGLGLDPGSVSAGMAVWVGVSWVTACATLDRTALPLLSLAAATAGVGAAAALFWPVRRRGRTRAPLLLAVVCVLLVTAVAAVNAALVRPEHVASYALWFPGLVATPIGGLAVRRRPVASVVAAAGAMAALLWLGAVRLQRPDWVAWALVLSTPVLLWCVGGIVVARLLQLSQLELRRTSGLLQRDLAHRERARALAAARAQREELLQRTAIPLLEALASEGGSAGPAAGPVLAWSPGLREQVVEVNAELRAEIRGRDLLDTAVRQAARDARLRGVRVTVVDDAPPGADSGTLPQLRELLAAVVEACVDGEVTARRPASGAGLTVVHLGSPGSREAVAAAGRAVARARRLDGVEVSTDDDAVVVDVAV